MSPRLPPHGSVRRCGTTATDVVVVGVALLLMAALAVPLLLSTRARGRRQPPCINNQSNIAKAVLNYLTVYDERLPALRGGVLIEDDSDPLTPPLRAPWTISILPQMDNRLLYDRLLAATAESNRHSGSQYAFPYLSDHLIGGYACPDDPWFDQPGALSYVANAGYILEQSWDGADRYTDGPNLTTFDWRNDTATERRDRFSLADQKVSRDAGVMLDQRGGSSLRLSEMYDGVTTTLLLGENLDAGRWADSDLLGIGFGARIEAKDSVPGQIGSGLPGEALVLQSGFRLGPSVLNSPSRSGRRARPSSNHPGGVVVSFCDGRVHFLSDAIDDRVYARILTPAGSRHGEELVHHGQLRD
jgi:hypothetical protein